MQIKGGATIWARQTIDSNIFCRKPDKWFKIWFYIVGKVNHKNNKQFKRGHGFIQYEKISDSTGATKDQIYKCFKWLKQKNAIRVNKTTRGMLVEVVNYDLYQTLSNYQGDLKTIQGRFKDDTINKNDKNIKNDNLAGSYKKPSNLIGYFDNNPVYDVTGKRRIKIPNGEWFDYGGELSDLEQYKKD